MTVAEPQAVEASLSLEKIYLKDVSFESPSAPGVFLQSGTPEIQIQLGLSHAAVNAEQGLYESVLAITATAKNGDKTLFLAEVQQAGIFRIQGIGGENLVRALEIACPHVLLPFAREAVSDMVGKGGFPPLLVNPVNFEALYEQKRMAGQTAGHA